MSERGPTTRSLDERLDDLSKDVHEVISDLANHRLDMEKRFGSVETAIADARTDTEKRFGSVETSLSDIRGDMKDFRTGVQSELRWIKIIGAFIIALMVSVFAGSARVIWDAATTSADVKHLQRDVSDSRAEIKAHGERLDRVEKRLDGIDAKLDVLVRRSEAGAKAKSE